MEAAQNQAHLGAWGILDSFRLNHTHKEKAEFTWAATAEPVRLHLSFPSPGEIHVQVVTNPLSDSASSCSRAGVMEQFMQTINNPHIFYEVMAP